MASPQNKPKRRWLKRALIFLFVAGCAFFFGFVPYWLGGMATTRRFQLPDVPNTEYVAKEFKFKREDLHLTTSDGVPISGWWIPAESPMPRGTVVLVHGMNRSRIEMATKVEPLHASGFNCILIDLRHHGASGGASTTFGITEKLDVRAAVDFAVQKSPGPVVLWGVSLGGATVTLAAADDDRVKGLITDSAYDSLPNTIRHHLQLFRNFRLMGIPALKVVPQRLMSGLVLFWIQRRGGFNPDDVDILAAAAKLKDRPTLFVANRGDVRIPFAIAEEMNRLAGPKSHIVLTDSKSHGGAWRDAREPYEAAVERLLSEVAPAAGAEAPAATGPDGGPSKVTPKAPARP